MTEKPPPSNRTFGLLFSAVFAVMAGLLWRKHAPAWPVAGGASTLFLLAAFLAPAVLGPLNRAWMALADLLHRVTSPIILGVLFFVLFTPVALFMKAIKRDTMARKFNGGQPSYWIPRSPPGPAPLSLRDQF